MKVVSAHAAADILAQARQNKLAAQMSTKLFRPQMVQNQRTDDDFNARRYSELLSGNLIIKRFDARA